MLDKQDLRDAILLGFAMWAMWAFGFFAGVGVTLAWPSIIG